MEHLVEYQRPELREPLLLVAFSGWNDAAETATTALRVLIRQWEADLCAEIDPEAFFVFTESRPRVSGISPSRRLITWPETRFFAARVPEAPRDFLLLLGIEPQLRWKTFVRTVLDYASSLGVTMVLSLGGLLAEVLHSRPPVLTGALDDRELARRLSGVRLRPSRYEGPTGILGVLGAACRERGFSTGSLWANVPHYLASSTNPVLASTLVHAVATLFGLTLDTSELDDAAARFNRQVAEAIANNPEVASYVRQLEQRAPATDAEPEPPPGDTASPDDLPSAETIVRQLEDFLRRQGGDQDA